jgi:hypothetical protein
MLAGAQRRGSDRVVRIGRSCNNQRVARGEQRGKVHLWGARLATDRPGAFDIDIVHAGQPGARRGRDLQRVIAAKMAGAGNADADGWRNGQGRAPQTMRA